MDGLDDLDFAGTASQLPDVLDTQDTASPDDDCELTAQASHPAATGVRGGRDRGGRAGGGQSSSQAALKIRGPNWTESESLVLIEQKRLEYEERHHPSTTTAKKIMGKDAWRRIEAGCNSVAGFRVRDVDQITNKWDTLYKEFKKLKEYLSSSGASEWWGLSKLEKKELSKVRKLPLEFTEVMYNAMDSWIGQRTIFTPTMNVVDTDRSAGTVPAKFVRGTGSSPGRTQAAGSAAANVSPSPATPTPSDTGTYSSATLSPSPAPSTLGDGTLGSSGRKRKLSETDNLVDYVKDFNHDCMARVEVQESEKRARRSSVPALDKECEARLATKDASAASMDEKLYQLEVLKISMEQKKYELEVQKNKNFGNMTSALLKMASSMEMLTRGLVGGGIRGISAAAVSGLGGLHGEINIGGASTSAPPPSRHPSGPYNGGRGSSEDA